MKYSFEASPSSDEASSPHHLVVKNKELPTATTTTTPSKSPFDSSLSPLAPVESPTVRKSSSLITTRRARPALYSPSPSKGMASGMTPEPKRFKQIEEGTTPNTSNKAPAFRVQYPPSNVVAVPSKAVLKTLLKQALQGNDEQDQHLLEPAGILSLQQVLLPAIALQEEAALKKVQAKIQRDAPEHKVVVEEGRRLIRASIRNAMAAVEANRQKRSKLQEIRRQDAAARARQERRVRRQERDRLRQLDLETQRQEVEKARQQHLKDLKRMHNRKLYTEIVSLTRSITQLTKEEKMWKEALAKQEDWKASAATVEEATITSDSTEDTASPSGVQDAAAALQERTTTTVQDMVLASKRIQQGLRHVLSILKDSETARQELYKEYRHNHHFQGYQGVRNPRGLIRFLSQED